MPDFSSRSLLPEKMDEPGVSEKEIHQALLELETINRLLGGYNVILNALNNIEWPDQPLSIMDLGCGGGDMLRAISKWATANNKKVKLIGIDRNKIMTDFAKLHSDNFTDINFKTMDVFHNELMKEKADITMNSLFCHHFENDQLVVLIQRMNELATRYVIINDLDRNWFAYYSIRLLTKLFSKTYLVKYDGPLSVARSLNRKEWKSVLLSAGITNYRLRWMWAWRWQIIIKKDDHV